MQAEISAILELQPEWVRLRTADEGESMELRALYVTGDMPARIEEHRADISARLLVDAADVEIEGKNSTGNFSRVPWVRIANRELSPNPRTGWYAVYLFAESGDEASLSLNQGTQIYDGMGFRSRPDHEIRTRSDWARTAIAAEIAARPRLDTMIQLGVEDKARAYTLGNVAAYRYPRDAVPDDATLVADLLDMITLLQAVYRAEAGGPPPGEPAPEIVEAERVLQQLAGNPVPSRGGFRANVKQRKAIELRAMKIVTDHFVGLGATVKDVSARQPYDLDVTLNGTRSSVEVKGTAGDGTEVLLTRGEVEHHRGVFPNNALAVVHGIRLQGPADAPQAVGGALKITAPWSVLDEALTPISYRYATEQP